MGLLPLSGKKKLSTKIQPKSKKRPKTKKASKIAQRRVKRLRKIQSAPNNVSQALSAYINARNSNGMRFYNEQALPSIPWKRSIVQNLTTDASGRILLSLQSGASAAIPYQAVQMNITSLSDLSSNTSSQVFSVSFPYNNEYSNHNVNFAQVHFTYVGRVLDCGGTASVLQFTNTSKQNVQDNIANAHESLHGFVVPISNKPIIFRDKAVHTVAQTASDIVGLTGGYVFLQGLPASSACIMMEMIVLGEYFPDVAEGYYTMASHEGRLSAQQQDIYTKAISVPRIDRHLHDQDHQDRIVPLPILAETTQNGESWVQRTKHLVKKALSYGQDMAELLRSLRPMLASLI